MPRLAALALAVAIVALPLRLALAQTTDLTTTFVTIDGVGLRANGFGQVVDLVVTGVVLSETSTRSITFAQVGTGALEAQGYARCERLILMATARPGAFRVVIEHTPPPVMTVHGCFLERAP